MKSKRLLLILCLFVSCIGPYTCLAKECLSSEKMDADQKTTCPPESERIRSEDQAEMEEEMSPKWNFFSIAKESAKTSLKNNKPAGEILDFLPAVSGLLRYAFWFKFDNYSHKTNNKINRIFLWVDKDFYDDAIGYHFDLQYQQGKFGQFPRAAWMQEGYGYINTPIGKVKAGQVFVPFGVLWDHTFYGGAIYYKGYMYDADYGVVLENTADPTESVRIVSSFGYYWKSDGLNGATAIGAGIEKNKGGEKNTFVGRINPQLKISKDINISCGASIQGGGIRHPGSYDQLAVEADASICVGPVSFLGEWVYYDQAFPSKDPENRGNLLEWEIYWDVYRNREARFFKAFVLKYNYSEDLPKNGNGLGTMHQPAAVLEITDSFKVEANYVNWNIDGKDAENSLWIVLYLSF